MYIRGNIMDNYITAYVVASVKSALRSGNKPVFEYKDEYIRFTYRKSGFLGIKKNVQSGSAVWYEYALSKGLCDVKLALNEKASLICKFADGKICTYEAECSYDEANNGCFTFTESTYIADAKGLENLDNSAKTAELLINAKRFLLENGVTDTFLFTTFNKSIDLINGTKRDVIKDMPLLQLPQRNLMLFNAAYNALNAFGKEGFSDVVSWNIKDEKKKEEGFAIGKKLRDALIAMMLYSVNEY